MPLGLHDCMTEPAWVDVTSSFSIALYIAKTISSLKLAERENIDGGELQLR